jgi:signal transduction histidine kinase
MMKLPRLKLIDQLTLWFLLVTALVLLAGGVIVFHVVQREIIREDARRLQDTVELLARNLQEGTEIEQLDGYQVNIEELDPAAREIPLHVLDTLAWFPPHQHYERELRAVASYKINNKHYQIAASNLVPEQDEIADGVVQSLGWTFILLLVLVGLLSRFLSCRILAPFNQTLQAVRSFSLAKQSPLRLSSTRTSEFKLLNQFLEKMSRKAVADYRSLKEFTENASHELQTPLAVIRGKLELLMETEISDRQASLILAAHEAVERLSKTNQALTLLTRLGNQEYKSTSLINLSTLLHHALRAYHELFQMKAIGLETEVEEEVEVRLNAALADILLHNLISNAIRHNNQDGRVKVTLTSAGLLIQNTGKTPQLQTEKLFQRFKKDNQSADSVGLGLAIVKQVCDLNGFEVSYQYQEGWHKLEVLFNPPSQNIPKAAV